MLLNDIMNYATKQLTEELTGREEGERKRRTGWKEGGGREEGEEGIRRKNNF